MRRGNRLFAAVALVVVALDQLTKALVVARFAPGEGWPDPSAGIGQVFRLVHVHNTGVAFGLFQGRNALFMGLAASIAVGLAVYQSRLPADARWLRAAFGLQVGGALGNLIDRARLGYVTDFLDVRWDGVFHWPTFNVADTSVVVGVCMLAWHLWRHPAVDAEDRAPAQGRPTSRPAAPALGGEGPPGDGVR